MKKRVTDTSIESYHKVDHLTRKMQILKLLGDGVPRTAMQCAVELGGHDRNYTHPRITALIEAGMVVELPDKVVDRITDRRVTAYQITEHGARWLSVLEGSDSA